MPVLLRKIIPCFPNRQLVLNSLYSPSKLSLFPLMASEVLFLRNEMPAVCKQISRTTQQQHCQHESKEMCSCCQVQNWKKFHCQDQCSLQVYINSTPLTSWLFSSSKLKSLDAFATGNAHRTNFDVHVRLAYSLLGRLTSGCCPTLPAHIRVQATSHLDETSKKAQILCPLSHPNEQALG